MKAEYRDEAEYKNEFTKQVLNGACPYCGRKGFKSIASHTYWAHGVSAFQLREIMGLNITSSICSPEYREKSQKNAQKIGLGHAIVGCQKYKNKKHRKGIRPEGLANIIKDRKSDKRLLAFKEAMSKIDRSEQAKKRPRHVVEAQTKRILEAANHHRERILQNS